MFKVNVLTAALAVGFTASAIAAPAYHVVVPVVGRIDPATIEVSLAGSALPSAIAGVPYAGFDFARLLAVTGDSAYSGFGVKWSVAAGELPPGLTLSPDGKLSGTPTADGSSQFSVRATYRNKAGSNAYQIVVGRITVALAQGSLPEALVGQPYSVNLMPLLRVAGDSEHNPALATWTAEPDSLPKGLSLSNAGVISGSPTEAGNRTVKVRASYRGVTGQQTYNILTVKISIALSPSFGAPEAVRGSAYYLPLGAFLSGTTAGYSTSWRIASGTLPAGLVFSGTTGLISGTPTVAGDSSITVEATHRGATASRTYPVNVSEAVPSLTATPASLDFGTIKYGSSATQTFTITNTGNTPVRFSSGIGAAYFEEDSYKCSYIYPGSTCTVTVTFQHAPRDAIGKFDWTFNGGGGTTTKLVVPVSGKIIY